VLRLRARWDGKVALTSAVRRVNGKVQREAIEVPLDDMNVRHGPTEVRAASAEQTLELRVELGPPWA
jgi:hypothetical protein